jgi:D-alanine-D-alanine ligase
MAKKVALLLGGWSAERQVSLEKGKAVEKALREGGYDVTVIDVKKDLNALVAALTPKPDAVFNNLHGRGGEDGEVQSVLEILEIPYTHSKVLASAIGMHKPTAKRVVAAVGVPVADAVIAPIEKVLTGHVMAPPYVVKPIAEGSSVGVRIILDSDNQMPLDKDNWAFGEEVMVERYIPGRELTVAVLDGKAQAVTEIVSHTRFFDYEAKYHDTRTEYVMPAKIPQAVYDAALDYAERAFNAIGCNGLARCDFRYDDTKQGAAKGDNGLCFLEINTQPGLTPGSIGPSQVIHNGMSFVELCSHLVETASCESQQQTKAPSLGAAGAAEKRRA